MVLPTSTAKDCVSKAQTSVVPLWLVGLPIKKLREHIGSRAVVDEAEPAVHWLGLGVGTGSGEARFEASFGKRKVVTITVATNTTDATREAVVAHLTALYGAQVDDDGDDGGLVWKKSKPAIRVDDFDGARIRLTAGNLPVTE